MKFLGKEYCDGCGEEGLEENCSYSRRYVLHGLEYQDRCLGETAVDILKVENALYEKHKEHLHFYRVEDALSDTSFFFCDECCSYPEDIAIEFEHKVRAVRSRVLHRLLDSKIESPKPKHMKLPARMVTFANGNVSCAYCQFRSGQFCHPTQMHIVYLNERLLSCPLEESEIEKQKE